MEAMGFHHRGESLIRLTCVVVADGEPDPGLSLARKCLGPLVIESRCFIVISNNLKVVDCWDGQLLVGVGPVAQLVSLGDAFVGSVGVAKLRLYRPQRRVRRGEIWVDLYGAFERRDRRLPIGPPERLVTLSVGLQGFK